MVVFAQVFGGMAGMSSGDLPYPIFVYAGLLPWTFVSQATGKAAMSVASSERLVEKVYFPRLVIPISAVAGAMVDFFIAFVVLVLMMFWYGIVPPATVALLPVAILLLCLISLGIGVLYASLNITYRDFRHIIGFVLQIWMFLTPSIYMDVRALHPGDGSTTPTGPEAASPAAYQPPTTLAHIKSLPKSPQKLAADEIARDFHAWLSPLDLNPLTAIIAFFRASILGGPIPWFMLVKSTLVSSLLLTIGLVYFRRTEDRFADII